MVRDTSFSALLEIEGSAATIRGLILREIIAKDGATDEELEKALGIKGSTQRPRRRELEQQGLIQDSGLRRLTSSGREAIVWVAVEDPMPVALPKRGKKGQKGLAVHAPSRREVQTALQELRELVRGRAISAELTRVGLWLRSISQDE